MVELDAQEVEEALTALEVTWSKVRREIVTILNGREAVEIAGDLVATIEEMLDLELGAEGPRDAGEGVVPDGRILQVAPQVDRVDVLAVMIEPISIQMLHQPIMPKMITAGKTLGIMVNRPDRMSRSTTIITNAITAKASRKLSTRSLSNSRCAL